MYRRIVALLLLPCVVLPQSGAAFGHAHGGHEPADHALRPHFHTSHDSPHTHHAHTHQAHSHQDGDDHRVEYGLAAEESDRGDSASPLSEHEHDSDAIYVHHVDIVVRPRTAACEVIGDLYLLFGLAEPQLSTALLVSLGHGAVGPSHPPPCGGYACPLYLWQRALLI